MRRAGNSEEVCTIQKERNGSQRELLKAITTIKVEVKIYVPFATEVWDF